MEPINLLDYEQQAKVVYSNRAMRCLVWGLVCFCIPFVLAYLVAIWELDVALVFWFIAAPWGITTICAIVGIWASLQSIRFYEKDTIRKYLGLMGNILMLIITFLLIIAVLPQEVAVDIPPPQPQAPLENTMEEAF